MPDMNAPGNEPDRTSDTPLDEEWVRATLHHGAAEVHPHDRLEAIRARTRRSAPARAPRSRWLYPVVASGAVAASVVAATVLGPHLFSGTKPADPSATRNPAASATESPGSDPAIPVYYALASGPDRSTSWGRALPLAREFHRDEGGDRMGAAVRELARTPADADYRTFVPEGLVTGAKVVDGTLQVEIQDDNWAVRQNTMTAAQARTAVLQIVYTTRAAAGQARLPVEFLAEGRPMPRLLGVEVRQAVALPDREALAPIALSSPETGQVVTGDLTVTGRGFDLRNGWTWQVTDSEGAVVASGPGQQTPLGRGLEVFEQGVETTGWRSGDYVVTVRVRHPKTTKALPWADSRQFTIR